MTFWNVLPDSTEQTTLAIESVERRWSTGRGYCIEASDAREAKQIAIDYRATLRGWFPAPPVIMASRQKVIVLARGRAA